MIVWNGHEKLVYSLSFCSDSYLLASTDRQGLLIVRDPLGKVVCTRTDTGPSQCCSFLPNGQLLYGNHNSLQVINPYSQEPPVPLTGLSDRDLPAIGAFNLTEKYLGIAFSVRWMEKTGWFSLYDWHEQKLVGSPIREKAGVRFVNGIASEKIVAWSNGSRQLKIWKITKQDQKALNLRHICPAFDFLSDEKTVALSQNWAVSIWNWRDQHECQTINGHTGQVSCVSVLPGEDLVATGSWDGTVRIWDPIAGTLRQSFTPQIGRIFTLAVSPDGCRIAAGSDKGQVAVWDLQ